MSFSYQNEWSFLPMNEWPSSIIWHGFLLGIMVAFNYLCYTFLNYNFQLKLPEYKHLEDSQKRYVLKNLTKTFILFIIVMATLPWLYDVLVYDKWNNPVMHFIGTMYVSTDFSGLIFVPKLPYRTKIHHTIVCILGFTSVITNYQDNGLHRALLTLTYMSAVPYTVNAYLGLRYLNREVIKKKMVDLALYVYCLSILVNILVQHFYIFLWIPGFSLLKVGYILKYYSILYDDIKLAQYLYYKYRQKYKVAPFIEPKDERRI